MTDVRRMAKWAILILLIALVGGFIWFVVLDRGAPTDIDPEAGNTAPGSGSPSSPGDGRYATDDPAAAAAAFLESWAGADWPSLDAMVVGAGGAGDAHKAWWEDLAVQSVILTPDRVVSKEDGVIVPFVVRVSVANVGEWRYESELALVNVADTWRVAWTPAVLHPSLVPGANLTLQRRWPSRSPLLDASGMPLAATVPSVVVGIVPERVAADRSELYAAFEELLDVPMSDIDAVIDAPGTRPEWFLPVTSITRERYVEVKPVLYPIPGVAFRVDEARNGSEAGALSGLIGTTGEVTAELLDELGPPYEAGLVVGRSGMERAFERQLAGTPTVEVVRRGSAGDAVVHVFPGVEPDAVSTSLSVPVQLAAEAALQDVVEPSAIVAVDSATGEIRAVASVPGNEFNRGLSGLYPPGSTFKIVVAAALLEAGLAPGDEVSCPEVVRVGGKEFRNATTLPNRMTFEEAFVRSCNTSFIALGTSLDESALLDTARRFGFGETFDAGIPVAEGSFEPTDDRVRAAASMIGQGDVLASPLHMATVAAATASGRWHPPTLVGESNAGRQFEPSVVASLQAMMEAVVERGTGTAAAVEGRGVAGKTGTAQIGAGDDAGTVAWFVGYSDDLAFAVMVEGGASGGATAAPLAADFLTGLESATADETADPCVPAGADWPTFQGSSARVGCSDAEPIERPQLKWVADVGIQGWLNSPIVVGDRVLVGSAGTRRAKPDEGDGVYALDLVDGSVDWFTAASNDVNGVAAADGAVVVTGDEGAVWALDVDDGRVRWRVDVGVHVFGNPLIVDDLALVGDSTGTVWAVDLRSGDVEWKSRLNGAIRGGASYAGGLIYLATDSGDVAAFTPAGFRVWRTQLLRPDSEDEVPIVVYAPPTVVADLAVFSFLTAAGGYADPHVVALDRYLGTVAWWGDDGPGDRAQDWANLRNSPAWTDGALVIGSSLSEGPQSLVQRTGSLSWNASTGVRCERQWASPVIVRDLVVLPRPDGAVYGFTFEDGSLRWRLPLTVAGEVSPPAACTSEERMVADGFSFEASPAVAPDGTVIVASTGQVVYAITDGG